MQEYVQLAGEFEDIGDHLLGMGTGWAEATLKLALLVVVVYQIFKRFSLKAGIGALLGLVICLSIYNSREDLSDAFSTELNGADSPSTVQVETPRSATAPGSVAEPVAGRTA
ncbi:hypothetical protein OG533_39485 (plasmid) [Streptomyces sp. NBC_01186]|uniref:hypothetical protein n=1 Tax=unclassified Streptomyces TaxID=2593676 RepID=UPI002DDA3E77|nr:MULTISPECIES: hypothetical protein [unclassified Streptomyces]WSB81993.1 hypothetical protein OHB04_40380 [Streptomyces sp. NBC_01775]WSS17968.1 hypothetical protein OG533_39485 [Streptomyces sp. NBC_01186]